MRSNIYDVEVIFQFETQKAFCVLEDEDAKKPIWLPKSQCELSYEKDKPYRGEVVTLTAEDWLLKEKGLI